MYIFKKNKRRITAWCLVLSMILTLLPSTVFAGSDTSWDGTADTSWYNTTDTAFSISTEAQLAGLAAIANGTADGISQDSFEAKTVTLTANLDLGGKNNSGTWSGTSWVPIGNNYFPFKGTFNGNGKTISNLYINASTDYQGLFGSIDAKGSVRNLRLVGGYVFNNARYTAGITGDNSGVILNCSSSVTVEVQNVRSGGLAGHSSGYIINSYNSGNVKANTAAALPYAGGITGYNDKGIVKNCYNTGDITASTTGASGYCGTAIGRTTGTVQNVYTTGVLNLLNCPTGLKYVGVIAGAATGTIDNTYYLKTGSINSGYFGIGQNSASVTSDAAGSASKDVDGMKALAGTLGSAFQSDSENINGGYPVLAWQNTGIYEDETNGLDIASGPINATATGFSITMSKLLEYSALFPADFKITYVINGVEKKVGGVALTQSNSGAATTAAFTFPAVPAGTGISYKIQYKNGTVFQSDPITIEDSDYWTSYADYDITGSGTYSDPFQIATANQLACLANSTSIFAGKYVILTKDINLSGKIWVPGEFQGFLDGQGHSINNMTTKGDIGGTTGYSGLFSKVYPKSGNTVACLANIHIIEPNISLAKETSGEAYMGAFAGKITDTNVINCSVEGGTIDGDSSNNVIGSGGLFGSIDCSDAMENLYIEGCSSTAKITARYYAGGIAGIINHGNLTTYGTVHIANSFSGGEINCSTYAGGIVGEIEGVKGLEVNHSFSTAKISVTGTDALAGGLIGNIKFGNSSQVIGPDGVKITNSAVLNPTITTASSKGERLVGNGTDVLEYGRLSLSGNFGWEMTAINGNMVTGSELNGTNFTSDTAYTKTFWEDTLGFDFSDSGRWNWSGENNYPQLKTSAVTGVFDLSFAAQPTDTIAYANKAATFAVSAAGGSKGYSYQWEYSTDGNTWNTIRNDTGITIAKNLLTIGIDTSYASGTLIRCMVSDNTGHKLASESAEFTKNIENYTVETAKNELFSYYQNKGILTQPREAFSLLEATADLSGFSKDLPYYYKYRDKAEPSTGDRTGYFYWLLMDCYALGVDPHDYIATGKDAPEKMDAISAVLGLQSEETGSFKNAYQYDAKGAGLPAIILSLEMYFDGKNWGNESDGKSLGRDAAIQYFFSQIDTYDAGGKSYGTIEFDTENDAVATNKEIGSLRAQAEAVILLARLSKDEVYGTQAKENMNDILAAMKTIYDAGRISYTENMAMYVSALIAAAEADSAKTEEYLSFADTIITEKLFTSEAFDGSYGQKVGSQVVSGDADATAAVMMALGDYCNGKSLLADYVYAVSDKNAVQNDLNAISIPENLTEDITLPTQGTFGSQITWSTSNAESLTTDGKVTRGAEDVTVALTATAVKGSATATKKFFPVVKTDMDEDTYAVDTALSKADVIFEAIRNITLPSSTVEGVTFSWTSSDPSVLGIDGTVIRPALGQPDKEVALTLTATKGNVTEAKEFKVMVYSYKDTSTTKGQIEEGYYASRDYYLYNRTLSGYWNVWAAYSALGDYIQDSANGYVYNAAGNSPDQPGAQILALVALGENPYDYKGSNLVDSLLQKGLNGAWSVPVFNGLGLEAAGSNGDLADAVNYCIGQMRVLDRGPDIPGWAAVVLSRHLDDEKYKDKNIQVEVSTFAQTLADNLAGNSMGSNGLSYGCVITGFNSLLAAGELEYDITNDSSWGEQNPIQVMYDNFTNGEHGVDPAYNVQYRMEFADLYNTLYNDGNVGWITCGVSKNKLEAQKAKAQEILDNDYKYEADSIADIKDALTLANTISDDRLNAEVADYGEEYYTLYDAVRYAQLSGEDSDTDIAKEVADYINALPSVENLKLSDEGNLAMIRNAYDALTNHQQGLVGSDALAKLEALETQMVVLKRLGIEISGDWVDTPGYDFTLKVDAITQSDERYSTVQKKIQEDLAKVAAGQSVSGIDNTIAQILKVGNLLALYDLKLYDGTDLVEEIGNHLQFSIPVPGGYDSYLIVHLKADGTMEYIVPQVKDGKLVFSLSTLSPVGVIGYNSADVQTALQASTTSTITGAAASTGDDSLAGMYAFLLAAAFLAMAGGYGVRRKNKLHSDTK